MKQKGKKKRKEKKRRKEMGRFHDWGERSGICGSFSRRRHRRSSSFVVAFLGSGGVRVLGILFFLSLSHPISFLRCIHLFHFLSFPFLSSLSLSPPIDFSPHSSSLLPTPPSQPQHRNTNPNPKPTSQKKKQAEMVKGGIMPKKKSTSTRI
jgi:hypothetical protein